MPVLNRTQHVGSPDNLHALLEGVTRLTVHVRALRAAIRCYEAQTQEGADD
ncbi:MAG: hypothetical protein PWQ57_895 [Desulfovibrionales bacterium]|jgi:hypothetical protein|nr:hypothetical protein [Desulfovibrionales bacterium]